MTYILWPEVTGAAGNLGGKARALAELHQAGLPIPAWFALAPAAFHDSLTFAQRAPLEAGDVRASATVLRGEIRLDPKPLRELEMALAQLCPDGEPVAVRSSASDEDGIERSFSGQFDSFLFVPATVEAVAERAAAVWRSAFSPRVLAYREQHGLPGMPNPPTVLVQRMVRADRSGVAFGADPVSGRRGVAVVAAVWGMGTALVSGECDADTFRIDRNGQIFLREIAVKRIAHLASPESPEGVEAVPVPDTDATRPALSDDQVRAVAELVRRASRHSGHPRDVEWAIEADRLYLLQSRPITALSGLPDPDGARNLWDNSNIAESYNGITTPLTFSFARRAYTEVYRQMCRTLGVSDSIVVANDEVFSHMLGLIRGRVYYNLLNWYRLLVLLPGFTSNRRFMEQMMGVREGLPDDLVAEVSRAGNGAKVWDSLRMARTMAGMLASYVVLPRRIRRFHAELDDALAPPDPPLEMMRADELAALYRDMEKRLLTHWDPPLVNDLFAMIFYGLLGRLTARLCGDTDGTLRNDLVRGHGGMVSAEPAHRVREMAEAVAADGEMVGLLRTGSSAAIARAMEQRPALRARYQSYLDKFGDRCLEELKLESPTLHDDPTPLHRAIGRLAGAAPSTHPRLSPSSAVRVPFLQRPLFNWVLNNARNRVRDRENLRFERTRLFGRVRRIFVEIGKRFAADGQLETPRDVFYLEVDEILGFIMGTASCTNLNALAGVRRSEFDGYRAMDAPADRFETRGVVCAANTFRDAAASRQPAANAGSEATLKGIGCCPGIVKAPVRLILDPRGADISPGSILAAERTDPGWVMLFPAAAGLLVERGSLLSHSAIVAREMGIPAIVSIPGLTSRIADGDLVEMDGSTGIIRRLAPATSQAAARNGSTPARDAPEAAPQAFPARGETGAGSSNPAPAVTAVEPPSSVAAADPVQAPPLAGHVTANTAPVSASIGGPADQAAAARPVRPARSAETVDRASAPPAANPMSAANAAEHEE